MSLPPLHERLPHMMRAARPDAGRRPDRRREWAARSLANLKDCLRYPELAEQLRDVLGLIDRDRVLHAVAVDVTQRVLRNIEGRIAISLRSYGEKGDYLKLGAIDEAQRARVAEFLMEVIAPQLVEAFQMLQGGAT